MKATLTTRWDDNGRVSERNIGRPGLVLTLFAAVSLVRGATSLVYAPEAAVFDLCVVATAWRLWDMSRRHLLGARGSGFGLAGVSAVMLVATAAHFWLTLDHLHTVTLAAVLAAAASVTLSSALFACLAAGASSAWLVAAWSSFDPATVAAGVGAFSLAGLLGWWHVKNRGEERNPGQGRSATPEAVNPEEDRLGAALRGGRVCHFYWDLDENRLHPSEAWVQSMGFETDDFGGDPDEWLERIHPYYLGEFREALAARFAGAQNEFDFEYRIQHRDGAYRWMAVCAYVERDAQGNPIALAGVQTDITRLLQSPPSRTHGHDGASHIDLS